MIWYCQIATVYRMVYFITFSSLGHVFEALTWLVRYIKWGEQRHPP